MESGGSGKSTGKGRGRDRGRTSTTPSTMTTHTATRSVPSTSMGATANVPLVPEEIQFEPNGFPIFPPKPRPTQP